MTGVKFSLGRVEIKARRVIDKAERANVRALFRVAGFIRTTARRSMRRRKRASAPGTPPSARGGGKYGGALLKELMEFSVDRKNLSAIVGPRKLRSKTLGKMRSRKPVPNLHEFGGTLRVDGDKPGKTTRAVYPARPYMAPALEAASKSDKIRGAWANVLSKGGSR